MGKQDEAAYFKAIGQDGVDFTLGKPFSDRINVGPLLHNIAAILTIIANKHGEGKVSIVDIGCGSGWTSSMFGKAGHNVVGVDIAPEAIDAAKRSFENGNTTYKLLDYDKLAEAGEFDVAIFIDSLHHTDDVRKTLEAARAVMKPGGICIVCEPGKGHSTAPDAIAAVEKYGVTEQDMPPTLVRKLAKEAGWSKVEVYAHPSLLHRAAYKVLPKSRRLGAIMRLPGVRPLAVWYMAAIKKHDEGIVVLYS